MRKILLATTNIHKINEYNDLFNKYSHQFQFISLKDLDAQDDDAPETGDTFRANALEKAHYYAKKYQLAVICDDSGLEVPSLNNFPGIYSKRWLEAKAFNYKIKQLLKMINNKSNDCRYVCAIAYVDKYHQNVFMGTIAGKLISPLSLQEGFGFDSGFYLPNYHKTFSKLDVEVKNNISHRTLAFKQLIKWLNTID